MSVFLLCDGRDKEPQEPEPWELAQEVADEMLTSPPADPTDGALFYHSVDIDVPWKLERQRTAEIGQHIYYR